MDEDDDTGSILNRVMNELHVVEYRRENKSTHDVVISKESFHPGSLQLWLIPTRRRNLLQLSLCSCFGPATVLADLCILL